MEASTHMTLDPTQLTRADLYNGEDYVALGYGANLQLPMLVICLQ